MRDSLDELILDNASCEDGLKNWIEERGYNSRGFASARRKHPAGYPPDGPDCMLLDAAVFGRFKVLFADACPKTIPEAIRVATKIVAEMASKPQKWVQHLNETYQEIIDVNGAGTHYMDDPADAGVDWTGEFRLFSQSLQNCRSRESPIFTFCSISRNRSLFALQDVLC